MQHVQDNAAESVRRVIDALRDFEFSYEMDQGTVIKVKITVDREKREATVDFTGTSPQQPTNFNAPEPVTRAAVLYVFRVMVDDDIPMNAGCLRPINIIIPKRSMLSPEYPAAVVAGNVETSQAVTNCLFGALGALAAAQGTMNNLNFGNDTYQYYETICSGSPAGPGISRYRRGAHPHDQHAPHRSGNSGIPLSGRAGGFPRSRGLGRTRQWNAGDGVTTHHPVSGDDGLHDPVRPPPRSPVRTRRRRSRPGRARIAVRRTDGRIEQLAGCDATVIEAGEAIIIQTPTAGGYGHPESANRRQEE